MPYRLLLLDSNVESRSWITQWLGAEFTVDGCDLARQALERLKNKPPELLVMDLSVPDMDGLTFLNVLRESEPGRDLPVIVYSPEKTEQNVMAAFQLGVEDFLARPFDPRELVVRCRTVMRRRFERTEHWGAALSLGGVEIDPSQRRCVVNGKGVRLRPREFELLEILMRKAGRVLSRPYLLETIWGMSSRADTRAVDVMVSRVRKRLGARAARLIETVSKMGYAFRA